MLNGHKIYKLGMKFYSLNNAETKVSFKEAVIAGIAPDRGLYFPERIIALPSSFFEDIASLSNQEIAFQAIQQFVSDDVSNEKLKEILAEISCHPLSRFFQHQCIYMQHLYISLSHHQIRADLLL